MHANVKLLQEQLREMIEADREKIVEQYFKWIKKGLEGFLELRKPNLTPYEVYKADGFEEPLGIYTATNYSEQAKKLGWQEARNKTIRPAFDVDFVPNADEIIKAIAEKEVEQMVLTFLSRATEKLGPVVERKTGIQMTKAGVHGFGHGAWVGNIEFKFDDGTKFFSLMKIITNYSKYNRPYGQYPMTFHEAALGTGDPKAMASIEEIWASVGYVPPPPAKRPRWSKLVAGSVVMHEDQRIFVSTPSVAKKLGIPQDAEQIARIEANETWCYIEKADGSKDRFKYLPEQVEAWRQIERDTGNYNKVSAMRREFAYNHFYQEE